MGCRIVLRGFGSRKWRRVGVEHNGPRQCLSGIRNVSPSNSTIPFTEPGSSSTRPTGSRFSSRPLPKDLPVAPSFQLRPPMRPRQFRCV